MEGVLGILLLLVLGVIAVVLPSLPLGIVAIATFKKKAAGGGYLGRAVLFAIANGVLVGLGLGLCGAMLGGSVPDENAGLAAAWLGSVGFFGGGGTSMALTFIAVFLACRGQTRAAGVT